EIFDAIILFYIKCADDLQRTSPHKFSLHYTCINQLAECFGIISKALLLAQ
ncbi:hypothetical protein X975_12363, partial [Stegodyphus mimosarum]